VAYVWFDALINYVTAAGYLADEARFARLWPQAMHLIGKDILITHSVYWPTMLHAMGLSQPKTIFAHGWWVSGGAKMSKSLGNVVDPLAMAGVYGVDAFRYFLIRDMVLGRDADFDEQSLRSRYQADLANDLGNLLHRVVNMIGRYCGGRIPACDTRTAEDDALRERCLLALDRVFDLVEALALNEALAHIMGLIGEINRYLERTTPWTQAKQGRDDRVATILYTAAEALRLASLLLQPVLPERMIEVWRRLGWQPPDPLRVGLSWGLLQPGSAVIVGPPLFPRDIGLTFPEGSQPLDA